MKCPKCGAAMTAQRHSGVAIERCTGCKGLWFDQAGHELLRADPSAERLDSGTPDPARQHAAPAGMACPACSVPLVRMVVPGQPHIWIESCTVCYGAYFDAGEFRDYRERTLEETWKALFSTARPVSPYA